MSERDSAGAAADRDRTDRLVTGTVNAWTIGAVSAAELADWIGSESADEPRVRVALSTFFLEVPLATQVAFLQHHGIDEAKALALAQRLEPLGRTIPLAIRQHW